MLKTYTNCTADNTPICPPESHLSTPKQFYKRALYNGTSIYSNECVVACKVAIGMNQVYEQVAAGIVNIVKIILIYQNELCG